MPFCVPGHILSDKCIMILNLSDNFDNIKL